MGIALGAGARGTARRRCCGLCLEMVLGEDIRGERWEGETWGGGKGEYK